MNSCLAESAVAVSGNERDVVPIGELRLRCVTFVLPRSNSLSRNRLVTQARASERVL